MIQQLLRGKWLYVLLGMLTLVLYLHAVPFPPHRHSPSAPIPAPTAHAPQSAAEQWWPTSSDLNALQQAAEHEPWLGLAVLVFVALMLGMILGGLGMAMQGCATGRLWSAWRGRARRIPAWSVGELSRIILLIVLVASLFPFIRMGVLCVQSDWALRSRVWVAVAMFFLDLFIVLTILTFSIGKKRSLSQVFGISGRSLWISVRAGVQGYVAVFPWLLIVLALVVAFVRRLGIEPPPEPIQELIFEEQAPAILWLTVLLACVVGPLAEELFFRGVLYAALRKRTSRVWAMGVSGALFALVHASIVGFVPILLLGCLLAERYERTGSLIAPLTVHIAHNSLLMSFALLMRHVATVS